MLTTTFTDLTLYAATRNLRELERDLRDYKADSIFEPADYAHIVEAIAETKLIIAEREFAGFEIVEVENF